MITTAVFDDQVVAYLRRIGYAGTAAPTRATLAAIYEAHYQTVPFENLDIIPLGRPLRLDPQSLIDKIVNHHRGGYCYELNGLLAEMLRALGYEVTIAAARFVEPDGALGPALDHMVLIVQPRDDPDRWLVDAAGGRNASLRPLPLRDGYIDDQPLPGQHFRLCGDDSGWRLDRRADDEDWQPIYLFDAIPRTLNDFQERSAFHELDADSHFRQGPLCTIATLTGRVTLAGDRLVVTCGGTREERQFDDTELPTILRDYFQIELPEFPVS